MVGASEGTQLSLSRTYNGTTDTLNQARSDLTELLRANALGAVVADAELVLSELASNAIEASPDTPYRVNVEIADQLVLAVTNTSSATLADGVERGPDDVLASQGRGLMIVHALAASVTITQSASEITVTANLAIPVA